MARPFKPDLSAEELAAIDGYGDRTAAGIVSQLRGANLGSITQAEANRRRVSHEWIRKQRQTTQPPINSEASAMQQPPNKELVTDYTGPRMVSVRESPPIPERSSDTASEPSGTKVESEQSPRVV